MPLRRITLQRSQRLVTDAETFMKTQTTLSANERSPALHLLAEW
jgi:hypothetical protein